MSANPQNPKPDTHVTLTINGREVTVPKGTLVVEAAKEIGLEIPVFCYHPKLKPVGACRMCLVEIEKMPRLQTACTSPVAEGMAVRTDSPQVIAAQNGVIELLLANHPLDCPICDKGGECPLQDNTFKYGLGVSRFTEGRRHLDKAFPLSDRIVLDRERCIMCLRCVRFQREIPGDEALSIQERGGRSEIGVLEGETFDSPFSGNTIEICPVGALTSRQYRFKARPWDLTRTPSVCGGCAVGCNVEIHSRDGRPLRLVARENREVDDGWLCDYGRFDTLPALAEHRATQPLIRWDGELRPASWDEALARVAQLTREGPSGLLATASLSNEALWILEHELAPVLEGEDKQAAAGESAGETAAAGEEVGAAPSPPRPFARSAVWPSLSSAWPLEGDIPKLERCRALLLVGLDVWEELPVLALWVRRAVQQGGRLVVVGPTNGLYRDTQHWLRTEPGAEGKTMRALLACLRGESTDDAALRAAAETLQGRPGAVLAGQQVVAQPGAVEVLQTLAESLEADPARGGMRGSPPTAANGRGAQELAPRLAGGDAERVVAASQKDEISTLFLVGDADWPPTGGARVVQMTSGRVLESERVEVVLPLAHLYEQAGSLTNLAGRVQRLEPGALAPRLARPDWAAVAAVAGTLGASAPYELLAIRAALTATNRAYARALSGGLPPAGRLLRAEEVGVA